MNFFELQRKTKFNLKNKQANKFYFYYSIQHLMGDEPTGGDIPILSDHFMHFRFIAIIFNQLILIRCSKVCDSKYLKY